MTAALLGNDDVRRWVFSGAVVIAVHLGLVAMLTSWHERVTGDEGTEAIVVDLAPFTGPATESKNDLAPGPEQQQSIATPDAKPPKPGRKTAGKNRDTAGRARCGCSAADGSQTTREASRRADPSGPSGHRAAAAKAIRGAGCLLASPDRAAGRAP